MRRLTTGLSGPLSGSLARQVRLLLVLTTALAGFFLLLDFLVSLVSSAPQDILAVNPTSEEQLDLPTGVGLLEFAVLSVSIILALAVLISSLGWPISRSSFRPSPSLVLGTLAAAALVSVGAYLSLSGILGRQVPYDEHVVKVSLLESGMLVVFASFFLSLAIAGIVSRKLLAVVLVVWLVAGFAFGLLDTKPLDGLQLFQRTTMLERPAAFASVVERYMRSGGGIAVTEAEPSTEESSPTKPSETTTDKTAISHELDLSRSVTALQGQLPEPIPVFRVSGAAHTRYLRAATGDVYEDGEWRQLNSESFQVGQGIEIPVEINSLVAEVEKGEQNWPYPFEVGLALLATTPPLQAFAPTDRIEIRPAGQYDSIPAGTAPISSFPKRIDFEASFDPFSGTLTLADPAPRYAWWSTVPSYSPAQLVELAAIDDETYLQLPDDLPERVLQMAEEFKTSHSPYLKANQIKIFLEEELTYEFAEPGAEPELPPDGSDPVDWFLFEKRVGSNGNFSSAFVVLARAAGIPARVVSGWTIEESVMTQVVHADQAHQWAEIALEGVGWVTFDPAPRDSPAEEDQLTLQSALQQLTASPDPSARKEAAKELGNIGDPEALPALVETMESDVALDVRETALVSLQKLGLEALIWILLNHEDAQVRAAAARALDAMRDLRALDAFLKALSTDEVAEVRVEVAEALAHIGRGRAEEQLLVAATVDESAAVRVAAVQSLGRLKANWTANQLASILRSDPESDVRGMAAWALGEIRNPSALRPLLEARSIDEVEDVRSASTEALERWSSPGLISVLEGSQEATERAAAAQILGEREFTGAIPALSSALNDISEDVGDAALEALSAIGAIEWLENGIGLLTREPGDVALIPRVSATQAAGLPRKAVFEVEGTAHSNLLRVAVGDTYESGRWLSSEQSSRLQSAGNADPQLGVVLPRLDAATVYRDNLSITHAEPSLRILAGSVPISLRLESVSARGEYRPRSAIYVINATTAKYNWTSDIHEFSASDLAGARKWSGPGVDSYLQLPDQAWLWRVHDLADEITAGHSTPHAKASAIERYLEREYTYRFADSGESAPPPTGSDPVEWFLFSSREGTSGNFSSAFVALARAAGIPARVVSGWAIDVGSSSQTVYSDQAHQWAEVAFDGLGWVTFDPTPGGAPSRVATLSALSSSDPVERENALRALERAGADVTRLENGGAIVSQGGYTRWISGTTTQQSSGLQHIPIFNVSGAENTGHLRTSVGDVYQGSHWLQLDPATVPYTAGDSVPDTVRAHYVGGTGDFASLPGYRRDAESLFGFLESPDRVDHDQIRITPAGAFTDLPSGVMLTSLHLQSIDLDGIVYPFSSTFSTEESLLSYSWTAEVPSYSPSRFAAADAAADSTYTQLPGDLPERIRSLAQEITSGHHTTYARAKALERYLKTNYTYKLADPSGSDRPPAGRDPMDWFLFDHREGTCGVFSSAFVVLARSVGIPARVVSGWVISPTGDTQTVYSDQSHQWAEVAFEGLGWVAFEPTASGGAPTRVSSSSDSSNDTSSSALSDNNPAEREKALQDLERAGAEVTRLENGGAIIVQDGGTQWASGGTTQQSSGLPHIPVFNVTGASNTYYLRNSVGDVYQGSHWAQLDPVTIPYTAGESVPDTVRAHYVGEASEFASLPGHRRATESLFGLLESPYRVEYDRIRISPAGGFTRVPSGAISTSLHLQSADLNGNLHPFSSTFSTVEQLVSYSWTAEIPYYLVSQHSAAAGAPDSTYTQLPADMPDRIRSLALQITSGHSNTYAKARALESYLSTNYTYAYADPSGKDRPPAGRDPMDWFLFDHREGTCGVFSSAFVVLARSIGIPARVVTGWAISPKAGTQTVYTDQAHQWAEVAFEGIGWVTFEPTASGSARTRAAQSVTIVEGEYTPPPPKDTVTTITQWPLEIRRQTPFVVGGRVATLDGRSVSGLQVEIYVNETKEHGGTLIGTGETSAYGYEAEATIPADLELGAYQLLARAVGTDDYNESWSDPDITVFSGSGLELTGPSEVTIDGEALFQGKLSEDSGQAVAQRTLSVTIDGSAEPPVTTNSSGQFAFSKTFSSAGPHWVEVELQGEGFLLDNRARLNFQVTVPTETTLHAPAFVEVGDEFHVTGELRDGRGLPLAGEHVYVQVGDGLQKTVVTDSFGFFDFADTVFESGEFTVTAAFLRNGPMLSSNGTARLASQHNVALTIDGPGRIDQGEGATFVGRLESDTFTPTGELELTIESSLERETVSVTTDEDGQFEYEHDSFPNTGPHSLTGHFAGGDYVGASTAGIVFHVSAPTLLILDGPTGVNDGDSFVVTGTLLQRNGRAVPDAEVQVTGMETSPLVTGDDGKFRWESVARFDQSTASGANQSEFSVEVDFAGTDHLGPSSAGLNVVVGLPGILVDALEPVARGESAALRGTVLIGDRPVSDISVTIGQEASVKSNAVGAFTYDYPVALDMPLGTSEVEVSAASLGATVTVPILVKSTPSLSFSQLEEAEFGSTTPLVVTLLDDTGAAIPRATVRSSQGVQGVTDELGLAVLEVTTPDSEDLAVVPVAFTFDGDDLNMPISESFFLAIQPAPAGFNWLLWAGIPGLIALIAAAGFASRRLRTAPVQDIIRRRGAAAEPDPEPIAIPRELGLEEDDDVEAAQETTLDIVLVKTADELPDVWGAGEEISAVVRHTDRSGQAIGGAAVVVSITGVDTDSLLTTNEQGICALSWASGVPGSYRVSAEFAGDDSHLPSSTYRAYRVVDFREEIVRLYNDFLDWASARTASITEQSTPREVELILVSEGLPVDQKALDELVSRFEEADYSEHPISRRHYEAMHRAWRTIAGD